MTWNYTVYAAVLHISAIISALVGFLALRRRNSPGVKALTLLMFAVTEWAFASGLEAAVVGIQNKIFWSKLEYLGALSAPTLFLIFAIQYSQNNQLFETIVPGLSPSYLSAAFIIRSFQ